MRVRLLVNTREHPTGRGTIVEVDESEFRAHPHLYKSAEVEEREAEREAARAESDRAEREAARHRIGHGHAKAEAERLRAAARYLREQAVAADKLATEAERQADVAARALEGEDVPPAATAAPVQSAPPPPPVPSAPAPHKRPRFGGGQIVEVQGR